MTDLKRGKQQIKGDGIISGVSAETHTNIATDRNNAPFRGGSKGRHLDLVACKTKQNRYTHVTSMRLV